MNVRDEIMHFRKERARELEMLSGVLEKSIENGVSTPLYRAISQLRNSDFILPFKDGSVDPDTWGYEIEDFSFQPDIPRHVKPKVTDLLVTLNMKVIANCSDWDNMDDPLRELSFKVTIRGLGDQNFYSGFHIDRHDGEVNPQGEIHPIYHLQHLVNPNEEANFQFGSVLALDTPRVMHYPMEFVLGLGYLTANFFPIAYESLLDDGFYYSLFQNYQDRLWKPYSHTLANYWKPFQEDSIIWEPDLLCPFLQF
jgi:hypothetical protein